jgi:hypothetical protein
MPVDTHGLQQEHVGRRLRVTFADGQTEEIQLLEVTVCDEHEPCCGITYDLIATDGTRMVGATYWGGFGDVQNFQVIGD